MHVKNKSLLVFAINLIGIYCLEEKCRQDADCKNPNSVCFEEKCTCNDMSVRNGSECFPLVIKYKGYCRISEQCRWLGDNSKCKTNKCVCEEHYRWFQGKCRKYVDKGGQCDSDIDCYNGYDYFSLKCDSATNKCVCNDGYYDRGLDCRLKSKKNSDCAIDLDCQDENLVCLGAHCTSKSSIKYPTDDRYVLSKHEDMEIIGEVVIIKNKTISCLFDENCSKIGNSQCDVRTQTCHCLPETYQKGRNCLPGFGSCDDSGNCSKNNTLCFNGTSCVCKQGYYLSNGACVPEMAVQDYVSQTEMDCKIRGGQLSNGTCHCRNYWFSNDTNQNCIKTMDQQHHNCISSESCNALGPYSFCNHIAESTSVCECSKFAKLNKTTYTCEKIGEPPKGSCLRDDDCNLNEICKTDTCQCISDFSRDSDGTCLPEIGGSCETSSCSHIDNAKCAGGVCACVNSSIYVKEVNACFKKAENLYDKCEYDAECLSLDNAICAYGDRQNNGTKQCICSHEFLEVTMVCLKKKKFGDICTTSKDCTLVLNNSFQCRKSICQCPVYYKLSDGYCQRSRSSSLKPAKWMVVVLVAMKVLDKLLRVK